MAKETGLSMSINVDDSGGVARNLSNNFTDASFATPRGVQDVTGLGQSAMDRLLLLPDFSITLNGVFDDAVNAAHAVFSTAPSTSVARTVTIVHSGQTLPNEAFFTDYSLSRPASGEFTYTAPGILTGGVVPTWA